MKRESKLLKQKATASLLLALNHFNGVSDTGRTEAVLIFLDHSFEMLLKAGILHRGGRIFEPREPRSLPFDRCIRKALSDLCFISDKEALLLQAINGLRDAAQHHLLDLSEQELHFMAQSGLTLFRDIYRELFQQELAAVLPARVLPLSTVPLTDPIVMFERELEAVKLLLRPGTRKQAEAKARLRGLAIIDGALMGQAEQPTESRMQRLAKQVAQGESLDSVFPAISSVGFSTEGEGPQLNLRINSKDGVPIIRVPEGTPGATVVAVQRVNEFGFYNLSFPQLALKLGLTQPKLTAAIALLDLKVDEDCAWRVPAFKTPTYRYSKNAIARVRALLEERGEESVWLEYQKQLKRRKRKTAGGR